MYHGRFRKSHYEAGYHWGNFAVIECNCNHIEVIKPTENDSFVVAANGFISQKMLECNNHDIDDWRSDERYSVAYNALRENKNYFSFELAKDILSGKHGFMCQYERNKGADTVWSVIYDMKNKKFLELRTIHHARNLLKITE